MASEASPQNRMRSLNLIGFMQGRFSPLIDGRIQAFPWAHWRDEFPIAQQNGFRLMEWTLDQNRLYENPLLTSAGQAEIIALCRRHDLRIKSLTGDCFMQEPFWKTNGKNSEDLKKDFSAVVDACSVVGITMIVVPLVDNGRIENAEQEMALVTFLESQSKILTERGVQVVFESDFGSSELARFVGRLDCKLFGVNYDIGNSAAVGFDPVEEFGAYGNRIMNVHVKDRVLGGTTVPLGTGHADFKTVFAGLNRLGYTGNYILQTARTGDGQHATALCHYRDMTIDWLTRHTN